MNLSANAVTLICAFIGFFGIAIQTAVQVRKNREVARNRIEDKIRKDAVDKDETARKGREELLALMRAAMESIKLSRDTAVSDLEDRSRELDDCEKERAELLKRLNNK